MNKRDALSLCLLLSGAACPAVATPAAMNAALDAWNQKMVEYHAALKQAATPEQKAAVSLPEAGTVATALWKSICGKTGKRQVSVQPSPRERMRGATVKTEERVTYEFEEEWAAPAVIWFANHPEELAKMFEEKPRQLSFYADALLEAIERHHYDSPLMAECIAKLTEGNNSRSYNILEKVFSRNPNPQARGYAALGMSILLGNPLVAAEAGSQAAARGRRVYYLKQALALTPEDAMFGSASVSDIVMEQSYRIKNLSVGSLAPRITLADAAGKSHLLPEVGKPVLLFFWHPGEPTSAEMARKVPSLNQKYPALQIVPITAAMDSEDARRALEESGVKATYTDNKQSDASTAYRIAQLPTAVLLGTRCQILYIGYPDMHLQAALDSCFRNSGHHLQAESPASPQPPAPMKEEAPALREMPEF